MRFCLFGLLIAPPFQDWEYAQLLDDGVRPLAKAAPLATAKVLIEAVADMLNN
jgi:hypothetical protein